MTSHSDTSLTKDTKLQEARDLLDAIMNFAYLHGFHECGYNPAQVLSDQIADRDRRIAELEEATRNFIKGMDEAEQIRELVTKISGNPVNGVSAYIWWCSRYLNVSCFNEARKALQS